MTMFSTSLTATVEQYFTLAFYISTYILNTTPNTHASLLMEMSGAIFTEAFHYTMN